MTKGKGKRKGRGNQTNFKDDDYISNIKYSTRDKRKEQEYWDATQIGLVLKVLPVAGNRRQTGRRVWFIQHYITVDGQRKKKKYKIGEHPAMPLADARKKVASIKAGETFTSSDYPSLSSVFYLILESHITADSNRYPMAKCTANYRQGTTYTFNKYVRGAIGHIRLDKITTDHWMDIIDELRASGRPSIARQVANVCNMLYKNLKKHPEKHVKRLVNPIRDADLDFGESHNPRYLSVSELKLVWNAFPEHAIHRGITHILILTGSRISDVVRMRWDAIDRINKDEWVVGEIGEMKYKKKAHHLPFTSQMRSAVEPLKPLSNEWVFGGRKSSHITAKAYREALGKVREQLEIEGLNPHRLRHTFMTLSNEAGVDFFDAEMVLHHKIQSSGARYDHAQHIIEKKRALNQWGKYLIKNEVII